MKKRKAFISFLMGVGLLGLFNACDEEVPQKPSNDEGRNGVDNQEHPTYFTNKDTILYRKKTITKPYHFDDTFMDARKEYEYIREEIARERGLKTFTEFEFDMQTGGHGILLNAETIYMVNTLLKCATETNPGEFGSGGNSYYTPLTTSVTADHQVKVVFKGDGIKEVDLYEVNIFQNGVSGAGDPRSAINLAKSNWHKYNVTKLNVIENVFYVPPTQ